MFKRKAVRSVDRHQKFNFTCCKCFEHLNEICIIVELKAKVRLLITVLLKHANAAYLLHRSIVPYSSCVQNFIQIENLEGSHKKTSFSGYSHCAHFSAELAQCLGDKARRHRLHGRAQRRGRLAGRGGAVLGRPRRGGAARGWRGAAGAAATRGVSGAGLAGDQGPQELRGGHRQGALLRKEGDKATGSRRAARAHAAGAAHKTHH